MLGHRNGVRGEIIVRPLSSALKDANCDPARCPVDAHRAGTASQSAPGVARPLRQNPRLGRLGRRLPAGTHF
jgi:hypothetical protein